MANAVAVTEVEVEAEEPVLVGKPTDAELSDQLLSTVWKPRSKWWWLVIAIAGAFTGVLFIAVTATIFTGIGLWGNNIPVGWGFGIINFVWWIGIGHAGTFISAVLLLLEQKWRTSINRFAEAMTLFAVVQAGMFPLLHLGRPWFAYWLIPYPATMRIWPNFKSALPWDAVAVSTYLTVSFLFWYLGLVPDLASLRDRAPKKWRRMIYGVLALGWNGSTRTLRHYRIVYGLLAGLATPLVLSVHSIVSTDFAITLLPGWHSTLFPPFFVAGAVLSGFAMVLTLMLPVRHVFRLHNVITQKHVDNVAKMVLVTALIVTYAYIVETFIAWYSGEQYELYQFLVARPHGPNSVAFWLQIICNALVTQLLWFPSVRRNPILLWLISIAVNVGMWCERFVIIVIGLQRDFLPSSWSTYSPTLTDWSIFVGTIGFFTLLFVVFLRVLPFVPLAEVKELKHELEHEEHLEHEELRARHAERDRGEVR